MTDEDTVGLFYVRVPAGLLDPGQPYRLAVRSNAASSRRWFGLNPYADVLGAAVK